MPSPVRSRIPPVFAALVWLIASAGAAAQTPDPQSLGLPASVEIEAEVWASSDAWPDAATPKHADQRITLTRHPEWVRSRLEDWLGDLDWVLSDARLDTADESLVLYPAKKSGMLTASFLDSGYSSLEPQVTPSAWLRVMRWAEKAPGAVTTRADGSSVVYSFDTLDGRSTAQVWIDAAAHALTRVVVTGKTRPATSTYEYLDDAPLPGAGAGAGAGGLHHPRRVRYEVAEGGRPRLRIESRLTRVEAVPPAPRPPRPAVPRDFRVRDLRTGEEYDGTFSRIDPGQAAGAPASPLSPGPSSGPGPSSLWMIVGGAGLIALAGLVWQLRRRAHG